MQILIGLLALSFLIIVHEFGHFIVAKLSGIKVLEFALFMGPKLFSFQKGETTYSLRLIPLGGFVRMEGEEEASEDERAFNKKPIWVRAAVIAAGPIMNLIIAFIFILILTLSQGYDTNILSHVDKGSPISNAGLRPGDKILSYDGKRVYQPSDLSIYLVGSKGKPSQIVFERNGVTKQAKVTPEIISKNRYILGFTPKASYGPDSTIIYGFAENSPIKKAGASEGDKIIKIDDVAINQNSDIREYLKKSLGNKIKVTVERNGKQQTLEVTPIQSKNMESYELGITGAFKREYGGLGKSIKESFIYGYAKTRWIYYSLAWLITGKISMDQMSGPVGIVSAIGSVVSQAPSFWIQILALMELTALISINLGIMNLVPFPALDGSKLIILLIEGIRKKPLPPEREAQISMVGFVLLIMLMIYATFNDIVRMVQGIGF